MLDEKDLQAIAGLITKSETLLVEKIENRAKKTENLLLEELSRTQNILEKRMETVQKNLDELSQYHRITKLENDNTTLLLQMINDLKKEVDELRQKIA